MSPTDKPLSGTDDQLVTILLAWVIAAILHLAIGSISVAAITAAGILAPILGSIGLPECSPRGLSNRRISGELHISEATVKRHLANIYQKVGVRSRNEAVRRALEEQWIGIHEITSSAPADGDGPRDGQAR